MSLIYVETGGSDTTGHGSLEKPYQSLAQAIYAHGDAQFKIRKTPNAKYEEPTPTSLKKAKNIARRMEMKADRQHELNEKMREEEEKRKNRLKDSKTIVLHEDLALPTATRVSNAHIISAWYSLIERLQAKIEQLKTHRGKRVRVFGWVHHVRPHTGDIIFLLVRDGTGYLQSVLSGLVVCPPFMYIEKPLPIVVQAQTYEALTLVPETTVELVGTLQEAPQGKTAPGGYELSVDYWRVVGAAPGGEDTFSNRVNEVTCSHSCFDVCKLNQSSEIRPIDPSRSSASRHSS